MTLLVLKLILVPLMIVLVTRAGQLWGPAVAGWLSAFPAVASSILLLIAIEQGAMFGAGAAEGALPTLVSNVVFAVTYSHACLRWGWFRSIIVTCFAWSLMAIGLSCLSLPLWLAVAACVVAVFCARWCFPRAQGTGEKVSPVNVKVFPRVVAGLTLTWVATGLAQTIGPGWSGVLAGVPVLLIVLCVFSHHNQGGPYVVSFLRSAVGGFYSYLACLVVLAVLLPRWGIARGFIFAIVAAFVAQWLTRKRR